MEVSDAKIETTNLVQFSVSHKDGFDLTNIKFEAAQSLKQKEDQAAQEQQQVRLSTSK